MSQARHLQERRQALAARPGRYGLDSVEVLALEGLRFRLRLHFIPHLSEEVGDVPPRLGPRNLTVVDDEGHPVPVEVHSPLEQPGEEASCVDATFRLSKETLAQARYRPLTLVLTGLPEVDGPFSRASFSLAHEPADAGPPAPSEPPSTAHVLPPSSYLARDYESFSRLLLDRMRLTVPAWTERHAADLGVLLVELLAHQGDLLAYYQDAVAAEAYLGTARRRTSLRRHARLLDYTVHDGCNARTWVHVRLDPAVDMLELPAGTRFRSTPVPPDTHAWDAHPLAQQLVLESLAPTRLYVEHDTLFLYTWGARHEVLPRGATSATLAGHFPRLRAGDVLVFEELYAPGTALPGSGWLQHRHAVRLSQAPELYEDDLPEPAQPLTRVTWFPEDALPFPLTFSQTPEQSGARVVGNLVLADHGETHTQEVEVDADGGVAPLPLRGLQVMSAEPWEQEHASLLPASETLTQAPRQALPCVRVEELREDVLATRVLPWTVRRDLLSSDRFDRHFVAGLGDGDALVLRFGDGQLGRRPRPGARLQVSWRTGIPSSGNMAAETPLTMDAPPQGVTGVRNPLPARGGQRPEDTERIRRDAPTAFRTQERAVTEEDFSLLAQRLPGVRQAVTHLTWTGSWNIARVHVLAQEGRRPAPHLLQRLQRYLHRLRLLGTEVEVRPPELVPLAITLRVGVRPGHAPATVRLALEQELGSGELPGGRVAFFHPSAFGLGQPAYLAPVVARAASVPGVAWVEPLRFQRWGQDASSALETGHIRLEPFELVLVEGQPTRPDLGLVRIQLEGGRT
ncbi:baseplate J/gp47 family protein [Archangium violaceum]|uniref:baseplate J/gp47 family protein n=1 Tax=Archangium violaceum TaxID=83451 RepID=UPI00193C52CE|nr:baseplate J/gp47 family protein [Archangium violaceum]QRK06078.1 baseplate J/gp47 family protein [Archangium violaceum]